MWQRAEAEYDLMLRRLQALDLEVVSVHATQGRISEEGFLSWGPRTCRLAEQLGATVVTVHPDRVRKRRNRHQENALQHLRSVQQGTSVTVSVETFGGKGRVLRPDEIAEAGLPMTLDLAHIPVDEQVMALIEAHWRDIPVIHLSARNDEEHHLPVDRFCLDVVHHLARIGWSGNIVLEYLPWHHYRLRSDMELVWLALDEEVRPRRIPPPCDAYRARRDMWHHNAPGPGSP
jgi:sugar phosphate isomerase/epimerase